MLTQKLITEEITQKYFFHEPQRSYKELVREFYVIPFQETVKLVSLLEYGDPHKIALILVQILGCRLKELCSLRTVDLIPVKEGMMCKWKKGKNQRGKRFYVIRNKYFIEEIYFYLNHKRKESPSETRLFPFNENSLNQYVSRYLRPQLGGKWILKIEEQKGTQIANSYLYQLKSFRHNCLSVEFVKNYRKYKDAMIAAEFTAREFGHSSYKISIRHYCDAIKELGLLDLPEEYLDMERIVFDPGVLNQRPLNRHRI